MKILTMKNLIIFCTLFLTGVIACNQSVIKSHEKVSEYYIYGSALDSLNAIRHKNDSLAPSIHSIYRDSNDYKYVTFSDGTQMMEF